MARPSLRPAAALLAIAALLGAAQVSAGSASFSPKPVYIDPALGGWNAPLETLCFQAGCGEYYYVAGVFLAEGGKLQLVSRSKITLRRLDRGHLARFAGKLVSALDAPAEDLAEQGMVEAVVLTFYCTLLQGNVRRLEVFESHLPARGLETLQAVPLRIVERRAEELPPP